MAVIFYIIGWGAVLSGIAWLGTVLAGAPLPETADTIGTATALATVALASPALVLVFGGLIILAVAGVLARLDRIVKNTRSPHLPSAAAPSANARWSKADRSVFERPTHDDEPRF